MKEDLYTCDNPACKKTTTYDNARGWLKVLENSYLSLYLIKPSKELSMKKMNNEHHFCSVNCLVTHLRGIILDQLPENIAKEQTDD